MIGIYKITNKNNNKVYIGQSNNLERRYKEHFEWNNNSTQYIDLLIKDLGKDNFLYEIIEECSFSELDDKEKYWINYYNSFYEGYNKTKGGNGSFYGSPKLTVEEVKYIRTAYNNLEDRQKVYLLFNDKITFDGFCRVWDGSRWKNIMPEVFTKENKEYHKNKTRFAKGENHPSSKLTDEEVLLIRTRYKTETAEQIWQDYKNKYTLGSFKQILIGVKYSHLPIYKKNQGRWINE